MNFIAPRPPKTDHPHGIIDIGERQCPDTHAFGLLHECFHRKLAVIRGCSNYGCSDT